jgi:mycothiol synthase
LYRLFMGRRGRARGEPTAKYKGWVTTRIPGQAGPKGAVAWRPARPGDAPRVAELMNASTRADVGMVVHDRDRLTAAWEADPGEAARHLLLVAASGTVVAGAEILVPGKDDDPLYFEGFVHPHVTGTGLGGEVVEEVERRAETIARARGAPVAVTTNVSNARAAALMEGRGYVRTAHEYAMFLALDRPFNDDPPAGIEVAPFREGVDELALFESIRTFFGEDWDGPAEAAPWLAMHASEAAHYDPSLWYLARAGDDVVGAVQGRTQWHAQADTGHVRNLAVAAAARRRGIGRALLFRVANEFRRRGRRRLVLGVDADNPTGAPAFYARLGLHRGGESFDYSRVVQAPRSR